MSGARSRRDASGRPFPIPVLPIILLLAVSLFAGCRREHAVTLSDINGVEDLRARFNRDAGTPRVVLLLSPT